MTMITRSAYAELIEQDIAALPETMLGLERSHIIEVLRASIEHEYPATPVSGEPERTLAALDEIAVSLLNTSRLMAHDKFLDRHAPDLAILGGAVKKHIESLRAAAPSSRAVPTVPRSAGDFWMIEWLHAGQAWWWTGVRRSVHTVDLSTQALSGEPCVWTDNPDNAQRYASEDAATADLIWCALATGFWRTELVVTGHIAMSGPDLTSPPDEQEAKHLPPKVMEVVRRSYDAASVAAEPETTE